MTFDQPLFAVLLDQSVTLSNCICQQLSRMKSFQPKLLFKLGSLPQRHSVHQQGLWNVPEHHKIQSLFFAKNDQKENTYLDLYWIAQLSDLNMTISGRVLREHVQLWQQRRHCCVALHQKDDRGIGRMMNMNQNNVLPYNAISIVLYWSAMTEVQIYAFVINFQKNPCGKWDQFLV